MSWWTRFFDESIPGLKLRSLYGLKELKQDDFDMDKKTKKRLEVLRQKIEKNQKLLVAAKLQPDEPDEVQKIENQIAELKAQVDELKNK